MKLRVPANCHEISHQGRSIEIAEDGSLEAEEGVLADLMSHGVTLWDGAEDEPKVITERREPPFLQAVHRHRKTKQATSAEDVPMAFLAVESSTPQTDRTNADTGLAPTDLGTVDPAALNRPALFAFLKAKGVSVSLPITNAELRAAARQALGG